MGGSISPIGVLNDVMGTYLLGKKQQKEEEKARAAASAKIVDEGYKSLFDSVKADSLAAYNFMTSPNTILVNQRAKLYKNRPELYSSILNIAMTDRDLTKIEKQYIEQSKGKPAFARNLIAQHQNKNINLSPEAFSILLATSMQKGLTESENKLINSVQNSTEAKTLLDKLYPVIKTSQSYAGPVKMTFSEGQSPNVVSKEDGKEIKPVERLHRDGDTTSNVFLALQAKSEQEAPFEPMTLDELKVFKNDLTSDKNKNKLETWRRMNKFYLDNDKKDTRLGQMLHLWKVAYAGGGDEKDKPIKGKPLNERLDDLLTLFKSDEKGDGLSNKILAETTLNSKEIKRYTANNNKLIIDIFDNPKNYSTDEFETAQKVLKLQGAKKAMDGIVTKNNAPKLNNVMIGKQVLAEKPSDITKSREDSYNFLNATNSYLAKNDDNELENIAQHLDKLNAGSPEDKIKRQRHITHITNALKNHSNNVSGVNLQSQADSDKQRQEAPDNYALIFPELYKIPEIQNFINVNLNQSEVNQSMAGQVINANQNIQGSTNEELDPDKEVRLHSNDGGMIVGVSNETAEFAQYLGYGNVKEMLKDKDYYDMLDLTVPVTNGTIRGNVDKFFKAGNAVRKAVPKIRNMKNLNNADYGKVVQVLMEHGIDDANSMFRVLASFQSNEHSLKKHPMKIGYNLGEVNDELKRLSGNYLDLDKLGEKLNHSNKYLTVLNKAINSLNYQGDASAFHRGLRSLISDAFGEKGLATNLVKGILPKDDEYAEGTTGESIKTIIKSHGLLQRVENAELKASIITLAYHKAKSLDPNGRISDRDFSAAIDSLVPSNLAPGIVTKSILEGLRDEAELDEQFFVQVAGVLTNENGNGTTRILNGDVRRFKAIPFYNKIRQFRAGALSVRDYKERFANNNNRIDRNFYKLGASVYTNPALAHLSNRSNPNRYVHPVLTQASGGLARGIPTYANGNGRLWTAQELKDMGFTGR